MWLVAAVLGSAAPGGCSKKASEWLSFSQNDKSERGMRESWGELRGPRSSWAPIGHGKEFGFVCLFFKGNRKYISHMLL